MAITETLLPEFDHEMGTTRRLLDRVPESAYGWKPHGKSMSLGELSGHLADIAGWCKTVLDATSFDLADAPDRARPKAPGSRSVLLRAFDDHVKGARASLVARTDAELLAPWTLKHEGQEVFTLPRVTAIRSFIMNHSIHHRGQLSVYLRMNDVPVPPVYGPTADER